MPEQKPIKFTELFHFSEPTNAKIKLNRNNTTFPAWDLLLHDDPEWEIMNAYRGGERNNNHKMNGREYLFAFAQYYPYGKDYYIFGGTIPGNRNPTAGIRRHRLQVGAHGPVCGL